MSSDNEGTVKAVKQTQDKNSKKGGSKTEKSGSSNAEFQIKPSKGGPSMDTSTWPLLLKVRPSHTLKAQAFYLIRPLKAL